MTLRILITGASGFIGTNLVREFSELGAYVTALTRTKSSVEGAANVVKWTLGDTPPESALKAYDVAIHLAHDFAGKKGHLRTVEGTLHAIQVLREAGTKKQIVFSSLSASSGATSSYGLAKLAIEKHIVDEEDIFIIRPGLVLGDGGIYGRIRRWVKNHSYAPLPDGGRGRIDVIDIKKLCRQTVLISLLEGKNQEFNLFEPERTNLRQLVEREASSAGRKVFIIPIPSAALMSLLSIFEMLKMSLPVKSDNLAGFLANQSHDHKPTGIDAK